MPMALAIGGHCRSTLAPGHKAAGPIARYPYGVASAQAGGSHACLERRTHASGVTWHPHTGGKGACTLIPKAQHNRPRPIGG